MSLIFSSENTPTLTLKFNEGKDYTNQTSVPLQITTSRETTEMTFSNSSVCSDIWEPYSSARTVTLPNVEGQHFVSVKIRTKDGFSSGCVTSKVVLDKSGPTVSDSMSLSNTRSLTTQSPRLLPPVTTDAYSGVAKYEIKLMKTAGTTVIKDWEVKDKDALYFDGLTLPDAETDTYYYLIRATDNVGNVSLEKQSPNFVVGPIVTFTGLNSYDQSNAMGEISVQLSRASPSSTTVALKAVSGSAIAGLDFLYPDVIPTEVTIPAGETTAKTYFSIMTSILPGPTKNFNMQIASTINAVAADPSTLNVELINSKISTTAQVASGYRAVRGARGHMCGLRTDNKLDCWGSTGYANGSLFLELTAKEIVGASNIRDIAEGYGDHTCYIDNSNKLYCFGLNGYRQLGNNSTTSSTTPIQVTGTSFKRVAVGVNFTCGIDSSDQVICWGGNNDSTAGQPSSTYVNTPTLYPSITKALDIAAGYRIACAIDEVTGVRSVKCWGRTQSTSSEVPVTVTGLPADISSISVNGSIAADVRHGCGLSEQGLVYCWGSNFRSRRGLSSGAVTWTSANPVSLPVKAVKVQAGTDTTCALGEDQNLYCWGSGLPAAQSIYQYQESYVPVKINISGDLVTDFQLTEFISCVVTTTTNIKCWGVNKRGEMGNGQMADTSNSVALNVAGSFDKYTQVVAGLFSTCALKENKTVTCWGSNDSGQLGNNSESTYSRPQYTLPISNIKKLAGHSSHFCALTTGGGVYCWGSNSSGQIGNNLNTTSTDKVLAPYLIPPTYSNGVTGLAAGVKDIAVGANHTCAITGTGGLTCWGNNSLGESGHAGGSLSYPQPIASLSSGVESVSLGINNSCAVKNTGSTKQVYCWGKNMNNMLAEKIPANDSTSTPQLIDTITTTKEVTVFVGYEGACYIHDGTTKCWGYRNVFKAMPVDVPFGTNVSTPTAVPELSGATSLALNSFTGCALFTTGKVKCWGADYSGIVKTTLDPSAWIGTPEEPPATKYAKMTSLTLGRTWFVSTPIHACAVTSLGDLKCWGSSAYGEGHDRYFHQQPAYVLK
nr:hypothetical protein BdHM001_29600 [Bdellovibrio sp. HM001]